MTEQPLEDRFGRKRDVAKFSDRTLDIDILLYDDLVLETPRLIVPHPRLAERAFVLVPMAEPDPDLVHPFLGKTMLELLTQVGDKGVTGFA